MPDKMQLLLKDVRACQACAAHLPLGARPIVQASAEARILIVGQAPGLKVHESGIPWDDASGQRLREWLGLTEEEFYDASKIAILPIGFCYPGKGKSGDLPPRKECFRMWHDRFQLEMRELRLRILLGSYAHHRYLGNRRKASLTETVKAWKEYAPEFIPLPHPSPLNNIWLHKNTWFLQTLPQVKALVKRAMNSNSSRNISRKGGRAY